MGLALGKSVAEFKVVQVSTAERAIDEIRSARPPYYAVFLDRDLGNGRSGESVARILMLGRQEVENLAQEVEA